MRIAASNVAFSSAYQMQTRHTTQESLHSWTGQRPEARPTMPSPAQRTAPSTSPIETYAPQRRRGIELSDEDLRQTDPKLYLLKLAIEAMTGQKIKLFRMPDGSESTPANQSANTAMTTPEPNWGAEYQYQESHYEYESLEFSMNATVNTADGQSLEVGFSFKLEREFYQESSVRLQLGNAVQRKDPLVINLDVPSARLLEDTMKFDVDGDGKKENIARLDPASGYLTLDRNDDNKVNNGKELFGALTGDGFTELRQYDSDSNQWIDEADAIFSKLRIWLIGLDGKDRQLTLKEAGIGALFLGKLDNSYSLNGNQNRNLGELKSTGFYLTDKGKTGTIQQIDLTI
ncbi:hypothetical protein [Chitinivorax sp. B]|uniref:hypothetical protein n=1 Tax=Chitinivorax sp. B TaxID=2502235 RepID=UPI0010FA0076|nr:hypothetical protein [Chitinivorax sp. B]